MAVSYGKGDKGKADKLFSKIIRSIGHCESCGSTDFLQCAHIVSRRYSATRTDLRNAFSLCAGCHRKYTDWPLLFADFVVAKIGRELYDELQGLAEVPTKMDWTVELERLKQIAKERGVK